MKHLTSLLLAAAITSSVQARGPRPDELGASPLKIGAESITWYTTWDTAKAEANRTNKPIFFMAAAHQCRSISGTF